VRAWINIRKRQGSCNLSEVAAIVDASGRILDWQIDATGIIEELQIRHEIKQTPRDQYAVEERRGYWKVGIL
jgi:hypothetical protein